MKRANVVGIGLAAFAVVAASFMSAPAFAQERPRIRVTPQPQPPAWLYPRPDDYSWPAPAPAYRQCEAWYQTEYRPSGTVITPQQRCRWVRG